MQTSDQGTKEDKAFQIHKDNRQAQKNVETGVVIAASLTHYLLTPEDSSFGVGQRMGGKSKYWVLNVV
jgi:hypothetical protein